MHIIGITGLIGSGKDAVANHIIKKYNYKHIDFGDIVRDYATKAGRTHSREDLQATRKDFDQTRGKDFFSKDVVRIIKESRWEKVVVTGFRNPEDVEPMRIELGRDLIMISVDADEQTRFKRLKKRGSPRDPKTIEDFHLQEKTEAEIFDVRTVVSTADYHINNVGTFDELKAMVDNFMRGLA